MAGGGADREVDGAAEALRLLRAELRDVRGRTGQTVEAIRARASAMGLRLGRTSASQAFNDGNPRPSWRTVHALARAMGVGPATTDRWKSLWDEASRAGRDGARGSGTASPERPLSAVEAGPALLEVHNAVLGPQPGRRERRGESLPFLTPYLARPHDTALREAMASALAGGRSVLAMVTGGSSTGKTRALYEALHELAPDRPVLRPTNAAELLALLRREEIDEGSVLWLNEAQRFFCAASSEEAASGLRELLLTRPGVVALGTLWTDPYWEELVRAGTPGDPHSQVRALLQSPCVRRFTVPDGLSAHERRDWRRLADLAGDRRMADALDAGDADGRVVQHLSGGPELWEAYQAGPGAHFSYEEHALVEAALTARHLGFFGPLPADLLVRMADRILGERRRPADPDWWRIGLRALVTGARPDGTRTDVRRALTALVAVRAEAGDEAAYEPADYLGQAVRFGEGGLRPHPAVWAVLEERTTDVHTLWLMALAAERLGFLKQSVQLLRRAMVAGLIPGKELLVLTLPTEVVKHEWYAVVRWLAEHVGIDSLWEGGMLLRGLHSYGWRDVTATLAERLVGLADLRDPEQVLSLLETLRQVGEPDRLLGHGLDEFGEVPERDVAARLLVALVEAGHRDRAGRLARRLLRSGRAEADLQDCRFGAALLWALYQEPAPAQELAAAAREVAMRCDVSDLEGVLALVKGLGELGVAPLAAELADRCADLAEVADPEVVSWLFTELRHEGQAAAAARLARRAVTRVDLSDVLHVAYLLDDLHEAGLTDDVDTLIGRDVVDRCVPDHALGVELLMGALESAGRWGDIRRLAERAAGEADLSDPEHAAGLLEWLSRAGTSAAVEACASRAVDETDVGHSGLGFLFRTLHGLELPALVDRLACRCADGGRADVNLVRALRNAGQQPQAERVVERLLEPFRPSAEPVVERDSRLALLLEELHGAGELAAVDRAVTAVVLPPGSGTSWGRERLAEALRKVGHAAVAEAWETQLPREKAAVERPARWSYGTEIDGTPAEPWTWAELPPLDEAWCARARPRGWSLTPRF